MTGNNKVWRAPLAGLAAVAMLATMGVAASTANAAAAANASVAPYNFTVTFNANGGKTVTDNGTREGASYAVKTTDSRFTDGFLSYTDTNLWGFQNTDLEKVSATPSGNDSFFTGWYTAPTGGEKWDASTFVNADVTLYAHYADRGSTVGVEFVNSPLTEKDGNGVGNKVLLVSKEDNKLAAADLPVDHPGDSKVVTGWQTADGKTVTAADLTSNITNVLSSDQLGKNENLKLTPIPADATSVSFNVNGKSTYKVDVKWGESITLPTGTETYEATSYSYGTAWQEQGTTTPATGEYTASEADNQNYDKDVDYPASGYWDINATKVQKAFEVKYFTEINGKDQQFATKIVDEKAAAPADAPAARNSGYSFAYYTESVNETTHSHVYSEDQFTSPVVKNTSLAAQWATKAATVTFDLNYGGKTIEKSYEKNQPFEQPTASRDGWKLVGWYYNPTSGAVRDGNPFAPDSDSEFEYKQQSDGSVKLVNGSGYELSAYDSKRIPANARLRINEAGELQYQDKVQNGVDGTTGKPVYETVWVTLPSRLYAAWQRSNENQVNSAINGVPVKDDKGDWLQSSKYFKDSSWTTYRAEIEDIQNDLQGATTAAEYAKLLERVQAAQAKLAVKTDQEVYRAYNKNDGDHYFTAKKFEYDGLVKLGWTPEGKKFQVVSNDVVAQAATDKNAPVDLTPYLTAVNSVYNSYTGEHLLVGTTEAETLKKAGWSWDNGEKPVFYTPKAGGEQGLYRAYNPYTRGPAHVYTADTVKELPNVIKAGWLADNNSQPLFFVDKTAD